MAQRTQKFLEVQEFREGVLILRDHSIRGILMVSSMNFALKNDEEQQAVIAQFQRFLNSLDFSLQIVNQSRKLNITGYFDLLKDLEAKQQNELLRKQTANYREFVEKLVKGGTIMAKNFYVVVPFTLVEAAPGAKQKGPLKRRPKILGKLTDEEFGRMKAQIWQRMEFVALGLKRTGLTVVPLNTEELIELFWSWYHPAAAEVGYYPQVLPELLKNSEEKPNP